MQKARNSRSLKIVGLVALGIVVLAVWVFYLFPLVWLLLCSFKDRTDLFANPPKLVFTPTLENYLASLNNPSFTRAFRNSVFIAGATVVCSLLFSSWAAYAYARFRFKGSQTSGFALIIARMMPPVVFVVPIFLMLNQLSLKNTYWGLILVFTAFNIPFAVWMLRSFIEDVPIELEEAAWIDGCTRLQGFFWVVIPLIAPGMAATAVFAGLLAWNEFLFALLLSGPETHTLPVFLSGFVGERDVNWGAILAAAVMSVIPPVGFAMVVQRHLIKGLTLGAVKG